MNKTSDDEIKKILDELDEIFDPEAGEITHPTEEDLIADSDLRKAEVAQLRSTISLRERLSDKVYHFNIAWSICVFILLLLRGFDCIPFQLNDKVLMAIIGTALVNVIGLIAIILHGLFRK